MAREMPCWEIMNCQDGSECAAWQNPEISCWDLAQELRHVQNVLGVCIDCIVYQIKENPQLFDEEKLAEILAHRKINGFSRPKCPAILTGSLPKHDDRRKARRFKFSGDTLAIIPGRDESPEHAFQLVDLSNTGLTFVGHEARGLEESELTIDLKVNGYCLKSLPGTIISDVAVEDDGVGTRRRYGLIFTNLSSTQRAILDTLLMEQGQAE